MALTARSRSRPRPADTESETSDAQTLRRIFDAHVHDVRRMVFRLLGPAADLDTVDDVTQQVFIHAHRGLFKFRGDAKLSTWLYGIAARTVLHHQRTDRRYRKALQRLAETQAPASGGSEAEARAELRSVWKHLGALSEKKRAVLILHGVEGMPLRDVAEMLDIPLNTARSRLHHARRALARATEASP